MRIVGALEGNRSRRFSDCSGTQDHRDAIMSALRTWAVVYVCGITLMLAAAGALVGMAAAR